MKLTRAAVASGILVATVALAACSSSGSGGSGGSTGAAPASNGGGSSTSATKASCFSGKLNAEGSSAQANAMTQWIKDYQTSCSGATINYNPLGSGDGVTAFINKQVQFAGSDAALSATPGATAQAAKACGSTALDLPMVGGPIAIGYNLKGVSNLVMNGTVLADIFLGKITNWNDKAIANLNPNAKLPNEKITPFYRSDASGTTYNVERYLAATASSVFKVTPNTDSSTAHFAGQGKTGSQGVAQATSSTQGGIGYFEYSYAVQSGLPTVNIDNGSGAVAISPDASSVAISSAKRLGKGNDLTLDLDYATKAKGAYPITLVTYEIVCSKYASSSDASMVKDFLNYTVGDGQSSLKSEGYAPLPTSLQSEVKASINSIS
ncbi:phosphate ABC transporter substrate-binding protein PstS [Jatrophihabitans endophyticus]|uniref:phosphate ABC transporter substrate-binding protein PstS n=1 Tax=Jatrophihabitans endophyticus TaxID=1206085 RepID=UPI001A064C54|nr:phosphate ABC transporter substrate-binding protein PstS [Jatrophihabitans endophyticus]MBE7188315.1 phosphate ABC transporter substrate-binding protein PstS [Jatrophihabitans endophyticus]